MKGITHGVMVGGVSSAISAWWIRREVLNQYDTNSSKFSQRIRDRAPLAIAGLGFTGLSTVASLKFDKFELMALADSNAPNPAHKQMGNHRALHSFPYVGGAMLSAHLLRDNAAKLAHEIARRLNVSHYVDEIIDGFNSIADWLINSLGTGVIGHIVGDIPTSSPLHPLTPLSERNLAMSLITNSNPTINKCLHAAGWSLIGGSWAIASLYLLCKTPPDVHFRAFAERIANIGTVGDLIKKVNSDIRELFTSINSITLKKLDESGLVRLHPEGTSKPLKEPMWSDFQPDTQTIWGIEDMTPKSLSDAGIIPAAVSSPLVQESSGSLWDSRMLADEAYWSEADADEFWESSYERSLTQENNSSKFVQSMSENSFYD